MQTRTLCMMHYTKHAFNKLLTGSKLLLQFMEDTFYLNLLDCALRKFTTAAGRENNGSYGIITVFYRVLNGMVPHYFFSGHIRPLLDMTNNCLTVSLPVIGPFSNYSLHPLPTHYRSGCKSSWRVCHIKCHANQLPSSGSLHRW